MTNIHGILTTMDERDNANLVFYDGPNLFCCEGKFIARLDCRAWPRHNYWPPKLNCYFTIVLGREMVRLSAIRKPGTDVYSQRHTDLDAVEFKDGSFMQIEINISKRGNYSWYRAVSLTEEQQRYWEEIFFSDRMSKWTGTAELVPNTDTIYFGKYKTETGFHVMPCYCNEEGKWVNEDIILGKKNAIVTAPDEIISFRSFTENSEINRNYEILHIFS